MSIHIQNARILTPFSQQDGAVLISGDRIVDVSRVSDPPGGAQIIDAKNMYLVPGYIDLHMHAGAGHHVMEGTADAIAAIGSAHAYEGTTTILPTTNTAPLADVERAIDAVREAQAGACDATIAGIHIQGPFVSPEYIGPDKRGFALLPSDADWQGLLSRWDGIRIMGLAPELPGALAIGDMLRARGVIASISHSGASYDQMLSALSHGFSDVTNIYTGCSTMQVSGDFHLPGITESALAMDELSVQVIADGRRLPLLLLQVIFRCKGAENILLVSDANTPKGDEALPAKSTATMALLVRNMVAAGVSLRMALRMATVNPARRIGLEDRKGRIGAGYDADLLLLDDMLNVRFCMAKGKILRNELDMLP